MSRHKWTVTLADCQQAVLAVVLGDADATENATEYVVWPMGIDAAVAVKSENTRHLPAPSKLTAARKCRGIEISRMLGEAQGIRAVRSGTAAASGLGAGSAEFDIEFVTGSTCGSNAAVCRGISIIGFPEESLTTAVNEAVAASGRQDCFSASSL